MGDGGFPVPLSAFNFSRWVFREAEDLIVQVIGGLNARTDYHDDPYEEFFFQLRGDIMLKTIEDGKPRDLPIGKGEILLIPSLRCWSRVHRVGSEGARHRQGSAAAPRRVLRRQARMSCLRPHASG